MKCKQCKNEIKINSRYDKKKQFCNRSCAATYNNTRRTHSDDTKIKIKKSVNEYIKSNCTSNNKYETVTSKLKICTVCGINKTRQLICYKCNRSQRNICIDCGKRCSGTRCQKCDRIYRTVTVYNQIESGTYKVKDGIHVLKRYVIETRGHQCEICKRTTWGNKPIPLILDHINGRSHDHNLKNVRLVCGNCDMLLPTYKSKNRYSDRNR
jgi:hypothetical protein